MGVMMAGSDEVLADINGNEARVIAVAGGTFYYDGDYYRATDESLNELSSRLDADDTDLDAGQTDEAIEKIYANVGTGVSEGYLQKIGGGDQSGTQDPGKAADPEKTDPAKTDPAAPDKGTDPGTGKTPGKGTDPGTGKTPGTGTEPDTGKTPGKGGNINQEKEGKAAPSAGAGSDKPGTGSEEYGSGTVTGKTGSGTDVPGTGNGTGTAEIVAGGANIPVDPEREALLDRLTGMTAGQRQAVVSDYDDKFADKYLTPDENNVILQAKLATGEDAIQENGNTGVWNALSESEWYEGIRSDLLTKRPEIEEASNKVVYDPVENALIVTYEDGIERTLSLKEFFPYGKVSRLFIIAAIIGLLLAAAGLGLSLFSGRRGLSHHTRKKLKSAAGITGAAAVGVNLLILSLTTGCGMGVLSTNTITQEINSSGFYQYAYEIMNAKSQQILMLADYDKDILAEQLNFNRFQFLCKQQTMDILNGKETLADPGTLQSDIRATLDNSGEHGDLVNSAVTEKIMEAYKESLTGYEIAFIKEIRDHFRTTVIVVIIVSVLAIALATLTVMRDESNRRTLVRNAGIACGAAMVVCIGLFLALGMGRTVMGVYISPEYLYIFLAQVLAKVKTLCLTVAAFCAAVCIGLTMFSFRLSRGNGA